METLHLTTVGASRAPLEALLADAAASYRTSQRQRTGVWSVDQVPGGLGVRSSDGARVRVGTCSR